MADQIATSFETPNYSGLLFNKGNTRTPFSSMIGGKTTPQTAEHSPRSVKRHL